ncbi:MAG: hypothetical protein R2793_02610 [Flavobacteriaceae bacterium]
MKPLLNIACFLLMATYALAQEPVQPIDTTKVETLDAVFLKAVFG